MYTFKYLLPCVICPIVLLHLTIQIWLFKVYPHHYAVFILSHGFIPFLKSTLCPFLAFPSTMDIQNVSRPHYYTKNAINPVFPIYRNRS